MSTELAQHPAPIVWTGGVPRYAATAMFDAMPAMPTSSEFAAASTRGYQREQLPGFEKVDALNVARLRREVLREIQQMLECDGRVDRLLYKLCSDATYGGFTVVVEAGETKRLRRQAQQIIDRTRFLINDKRLLSGWIKGLLRDGDLFLQMLVDGQEREVTRVKKLAAPITFTRLNTFGDFPADKKPFYQESPMFPGHAHVEFDAWEIVHLKWDEEDGVPYGKPLLASLRLPWRRLESGEKDMAIRRKLRAGLRYHHKVGTETEPSDRLEVAEYERQVKDNTFNPVNASQDYFSDQRVTITPLMGDATLGEIDDLKYLEGILNITTAVPSALTSGGRESATNYSVVKEQEEDYLRVIGDIDRVLEYAFRQIFDFALLLKGIQPDSVNYTFNWGAKDRADIERKLGWGVLLHQLGFSFETILNTVDLDATTYEEELARIEAQKAAGIVPYGQRRARAAMPSRQQASGTPDPKPIT